MQLLAKGNGRKTMRDTMTKDQRPEQSYTYIEEPQRPHCESIIKRQRRILPPNCDGARHFALTGEELW